MYEPIDVGQSAIDQEYSHNDASPFLSKTFTPSQKDANIEEFDFDFPPGFFDEIVNDETPPPDLDGIDDFLNDLINGKNEPGSTEIVATAACADDNNQKASNSWNYVEPCAPLPLPLPPANADENIKLPTMTQPQLSASVPVPVPVPLTKAKKKLTKCLKTIEMKVEKKERKPKIAKNPVRKTAIIKKIDKQVNDTTKLSEVTKVYSRNWMSTKQLPSAMVQEMDVGEKLLSLVQQQDTHRPLDLLKKLTNLDISKANGTLMRKILAKSNPISTSPMKIEQKEELTSEAIETERQINKEKVPALNPIQPHAEIVNGDGPVVDPKAKQFCDERSDGNPLPSNRPTALPDLATIFGFSNFGNISYENNVFGTGACDEEAFGQAIDMSKVLEDELEIIPIEVGEDDCTYETDSLSPFADVDLFGGAALTTEVDAPIVAEVEMPVHFLEASPLDVKVETQISEPLPVDTPSIQKKKPIRRKAKTTNASSNLQNATKPLVAVGGPTTKVKRPRKKKIDTSENCDGNIDANLNANAVVNATVMIALPKLKPIKKPRTKKASTATVVQKEENDENLAGFSVNELQESVAKAAHKTTKKPRKPKTKPAASKTTADVNNATDVSMAIETAHEITIISKATKRSRKKNVSIIETATPDENGVNIPSKDSPNPVKTVKRPRKSKVATNASSIAIDDENKQSFATAAEVEAKPIAKKSRKKKMKLSAEANSSECNETPEPPKPPTKPRKRKIDETANFDDANTNKITKKLQELAIEAATENVCGLSTQAADASTTATKSI